MADHDLQKLLVEASSALQLSQDGVMAAAARQQPAAVTLWWLSLQLHRLPPEAMQAPAALTRAAGSSLPRQFIRAAPAPIQLLVRPESRLKKAAGIRDVEWRYTKTVFQS